MEDRRTIFDEQASTVELTLGKCDCDHFCIRRFEIDICEPSRITWSHNTIYDPCKREGREHTPHVFALHLISASHRHMNPRDRPNAIKEPLEGILSRPKRQVPDPYRVLTFLTFGIVCSGGGLGRRRLGLGFGVEVIVVVGWRAIVELALFAWGLGCELVLFLPFLLSSPFGV